MPTPEGPARENPIAGPERVRRGASAAPSPRRGQAVGTMSPVLGRPPRAPRSRSVNPGARAPGRGRPTATGERTDALGSTGPEEAGRTKAGPRGTLGRHAASHNHRTGPCAKQPVPPKGTHTTPETCRACEHARRTRNHNGTHKSAKRRSTPHETHHPSTPVNRRQVAKGTAHGRQYTEGAHW